MGTVNKSGLEKVIVGDDVLEKSLLGERFVYVGDFKDRVFRRGIPNFHPDTDDVQLIVEKGLVDLCKERGAHPQVLVSNALRHLSRTHYFSFPHNSLDRFREDAKKEGFEGSRFDSLELYTVDFALALKSLIKESFQKYIQDSNELFRRNENNYFNDISIRYKLDSKSYEEVWTPWFSNLNADFKKSVDIPEDMQLHFSDLLRLAPEPIILGGDRMLSEFVVAQGQALLFQNEVQLNLEKGILEIIDKNGNQTLGVILDALHYFVSNSNDGPFIKEHFGKKTNSRTKDHMKNYISDIRFSLEASIQDSVQEFSLNRESIKEIIESISKLYLSSPGESFTYQDFRKKSYLGESLAPYNQIWTPSFQNLKKDLFPSGHDLRRRRFSELDLLDYSQFTIEGDQIFDEVIITEERNNIYPKKPRWTDHVQYGLEKEIFDYSCERGIPSMGMAIEALAHAVNELGYFRNIKHGRPCTLDTAEVNDLKGRLTDSFLNNVTTHKIKDDEVLSIVGYIYQRYDTFIDHENKTTSFDKGKINPRNPYKVPWEPWFKGLYEKYEKLRAL